MSFEDTVGRNVSRSALVAVSKEERHESLADTRRVIDQLVSGRQDESRSGIELSKRAGQSKS
ncbi:hypothetical protein KIPB_011776, partial [Kipferlia bialata]|eukprot:g11776.t1